MADRNFTIRLSPQEIRVLRLIARAEGRSMQAVLKSRATERPLDLDPVRALVGLIEQRAAKGQLNPKTVDGLREVAQEIQTALASEPQARPA